MLSLHSRFPKVLFKRYMTVHFFIGVPNRLLANPETLIFMVDEITHCKDNSISRITNLLTEARSRLPETVMVRFIGLKQDNKINAIIQF